MVKDLKDKGAKVKSKILRADLVVSNSQIIRADQILKSVKFEY